MGADTPSIKKRRKKLNADADYTRRRCKQDLRNLTRMHKNEDCDEICMGQLRAFCPWTSKGHQGMMQARDL